MMVMKSLVKTLAFPVKILFFLISDPMGTLHHVITGLSLSKYRLARKAFAGNVFT